MIIILDEIADIYRQKITPLRILIYSFSVLLTAQILWYYVGIESCYVYLHSTRIIAYHEFLF